MVDNQSEFACPYCGTVLSLSLIDGRFHRCGWCKKLVQTKVYRFISDAGVSACVWFVQTDSINQTDFQR